ncbi:MAG: sensor histidine kinase [Caulobacterales bacterium]|uniref:sensor histidine kinase n=1 Tax=Glycocaulis sp. TaxID=1969725 RepID=UPI003FA07985
MFSRQIMIAFSCLALLAAGQGTLAWWMSNLAEHRVERGRVAADLLSGFLELKANKQRLRAWVLQTLIGTHPDPGLGPELGSRMRAQIGELQALSARADAMDRRRGKNLPEHAERLASLDLLQQSVDALIGELPELVSPTPVAETVESWRALDDVFDRFAQRDLRQMLDATILAEERALQRERDAADDSLARARLIGTGAAIGFILLSLMLAAYFASALRRPLQRLIAGAQAYEQGRLDHHIALGGPSELSQLAGRMNQMAAQLASSREQERIMRENLEQEVEARTGDLTRAVTELELSEARRKQLLADIGHELRTPTTVIRGEAEIALRRQDTDPEELKSSLGRIRDAAGQLGGLIHDLLTIALHDAEALDIAPVILDPDIILARTIDQIGSVARLRGVQLERVADSTGSRILADPERLQQLLGVLLDNAVRYSHPSGKVEVTSVAESGCWRVEIRDHGIGLTREEAEHVFDRGYRSAAARAHRADGSGLGLSIARTLAARLDGTVHLAGAPGEGATAIARFPLVTPQDSEAS